MHYDQYTLKNGLRIIGERIPHFRSVSVGLWVHAGSQNELTDEGGVSHFIEHMVFKGTEKRTARQINEEMDAVGGNLNAYTSTECTCFYVKVVDEHLPLALDVLSDLLIRPRFDAEDLEKEKGVVIEEIAMVEDTPDDIANQLSMQARYGIQSFTRPILGVEEDILRYKSDDLRRYWQRMYRPQNIVLALAGNYDWDALIALAEQMLGGMSPDGFDKKVFPTEEATPSVIVREKDIEQAHICLSYPGQPIGDKRSFEMALFNSVFGGAMSSRLFNVIREEKGAAYSIYSYLTGFTDCGMMTVYAGTGPEKANEVIDLIKLEADKMARDGLTASEFAMAKEQLKASYILGLESTSSRMQSIGRRMLLLNKTQTEAEVIDRVNNMKHDDVNQLAHDILSAPTALALVGKDANKIAGKL